MSVELPQCIVADDHPAIRAAIRLHIEAAGVATVIAEAGDGEHALDLLRTRPDLAVLDMRMPILTGIEVATAARNEGISTPIVLLTAIVARHVLETAVDAGIEGFVSKESALNVLADAARALLNGSRYIDPTLTHLLLTPSDCRLSERELGILQLMGSGMQNKVIAYRLGIGEETVKTHVSAIMRKMDASTRTEAVVHGMRMSFIS